MDSENKEKNEEKASREREKERQWKEPRMSRIEVKDEI